MIGDSAQKHNLRLQRVPKQVKKHMWFSFSLNFELKGWALKCSTKHIVYLQNEQWKWSSHFWLCNRKKEKLCDKINTEESWINRKFTFFKLPSIVTCCKMPTSLFGWCLALMCHTTTHLFSNCIVGFNAIIACIACKQKKYSNMTQL